MRPQSGPIQKEMPMRKVVLYHLCSLDLVAFEDDDWFTDGGPEVFANLGGIIESQDDILLGHRTYDYWSGYWPGSDVEPFATFINTTRKHVVTSGPLSREWANTTPVTGPAEDYVRELKQGDGGDIGIHGSITLAQSLVRAGLVDELRLAVAPAVAGQGRRVTDRDAAQRLELLDVSRSSQGTLFLAYRCTP
jgi:dihydrofolate reductase